MPGTSRNRSGIFSAPEASIILRLIIETAAGASVSFWLILVAVITVGISEKKSSSLKSDTSRFVACAEKDVAIKIAKIACLERLIFIVFICKPSMFNNVTVD